MAKKIKNDETSIPKEVKVKPVRKNRAANVDAKEYIDNKKMTECVSEWIKAISVLPDRKTWPQMPNYLGECFIKIVNNYGNKVNFRNYSYLDDMKSDALLTCIKYAHNFNPEKSNNAFAYFTQITHYCFLQVMSKEKHQQEIKMKKINESSIYNYNNINLHDTEEQ